MRSSISVASQLYQIIRPVIKDEISGDVYIQSFPNGSEKEDIVIQVRNNSSTYLQKGLLNVNVCVKDTAKGRANVARFNKIVEKLIPILKDAKANDYFYQIDNDNGLAKDPVRTGFHYYNLIINFQTL